MKNATVTTSTLTPATLTTEPAKGTVETIRALATIEKDFTFSEDGRATMNKGAEVSASEFAALIADRESTGTRFKTQARWIYYSAGQLPNGTEVQAQIAARLKNMMSTSAFHQLKSEATKLCPFVVANEIKAPLSVLKNAIAELKSNPATGKLLPMKEQTKAAKELIPLLKEGKVTQVKVGEIRQAHTTQTPGGNPRQPANAPTAKNDEAASVLAFANALGALKQANAYLDGHKCEGDDRQQFVNILTDAARKLGLALIVPGAKEAAPVAKAAPVVAK